MLYQDMRNVSSKYETKTYQHYYRTTRHRNSCLFVSLRVLRGKSVSQLFLTWHLRAFALNSFQNIRICSVSEFVFLCVLRGKSVSQFFLTWHLRAFALNSFQNIRICSASEFVLLRVLRGKSVSQFFLTCCPFASPLLCGEEISPKR